MKKLVLVFSVFTASFAFAKTSAYLNPTPGLKIQIENATGLPLNELTLEPRLSCWTTDPDGGGEATTYENKAEVQFTSKVGDLKAQVIPAEIQISSHAGTEAPKKRSFFSSSRCGAGVTMSFSTPNQPLEILGGSLGKVNSRGYDVDLTGEFARELLGDYVLKRIYGGESYCPELGRRCPYCQMALYKKTRRGLKEVGRSYSIDNKNCSKE